MTLWWIGNALLVLVVIPVVVVLLTMMIRPAIEVRRQAIDLAEHGGSLATELEAVPAMARTPDLVEDVRAGFERYGRALDEIR